MRASGKGMIWGRLPAGVHTGYQVRASHMPAVRVTGMLVVAYLVNPGLALANEGAVKLPQTMQAAAIDRAGGPEVISLHTLAVPKPQADEVLIAVNTAGVAIWDVGLREHPQSIRHSAFPLVLGTDGAGVVAAVGAKVQGFKIGEQVYAYSWDNPHGGIYAEYVAVPAERVAHVPSGLTLRQAGAIATHGLTAVQGHDDALHLKAGDTLVIHGASGGVGSLALQFARLRGAKVLATATGEDGLAFVKQLGADAVVDGRHGDIARSEEHTSELQSPCNLVCRLLLEKKNNNTLLHGPIEAANLFNQRHLHENLQTCSSSDFSFSDYSQRI